MSNSNETLKKCCRCGIIKSMENFNEVKTRKWFVPTMYRLS